jgi:hypothetical protein
MRKKDTRAKAETPGSKPKLAVHDDLPAGLASEAEDAGISRINDR